MAKTATLTDDFATLDAAKWTAHGSASVNAGRLELIPASSYGNYIDSVAALDLTNSYMSIELVSAPQGTGTIDVFFHCYASDLSGDEVGFYTEAGNLNMRETVASTPSATSITYDSVAHRFLRLLHNGTDLHWDTSPDGTTWTTQRTKTPGRTWDSVVIEPLAGYYGTEPTPGVAIFDNLNLSTWTLVDHVEAGFADGGAGHAIALPGGAAATAGQIDALIVGSDTTVATPSGFTLASTFVGNQGGYAWYRICTGGESATVTITTTGDHNTSAHLSRWSPGVFDVAANAHIDANGNTTNPAVSTGTLAGSLDLVVTASVMTDAPGSNATSPSWSTGYVPLGATSTGTGATASVGFSAYKVLAGTASESPSVTWTNSMRNRYIFVLAFTPPSAGATPVQIVAPNAAAVRASTW